MFRQLDKKEFQSFLKGKRSRFPLISTVMEGQQEGHAFLSNGKGNSFFILHKAGFGELFGMEDRTDIISFLKFATDNEVIPKYFHLYDTNFLFEEELRAEAHFNYKLRKRIQLIHPGNKSNASQIEIPAGFKTSTINSSNFPALNIFGLSLSNKFWNSEADFLQNGFGSFVANESGEPVAICYSACVLDGKAEIDVSTLPAYQKKGFAKICVQFFITQCTEKKVSANWDCFEENTGSLQTAKSCGFIENYSYSFASLFKNK